MKISDRGLQLLMEREGYRNAVYLDTRGIPTVGCGHTGPDVKMGDVWTDEQVREALSDDVGNAEAAVYLGTGRNLQQNQFDALVSFVFNVGVNAFGTSTMRKMLQVGNYEGAAAQFDRWHIPAEIIPRRNGEKAQFLGTAFAARIEGA